MVSRTSAGGSRQVCAGAGWQQHRQAPGWETLNFILNKYQKATSLKAKIFCSEVTAYSVLQRDMRKGRFFLSFVIGIDPQGP